MATLKMIQDKMVVAAHGMLASLGCDTTDVDVGIIGPSDHVRIIAYYPTEGAARRCIRLCSEIAGWRVANADFDSDLGWYAELERNIVDEIKLAV